MPEFSEFPPFNMLDPDTQKAVIRQLAPFIEVCDISAGGSILDPGDTVRSIILVQSGIIKIVKYVTEGSEMVADILTAGSSLIWNDDSKVLFPDYLIAATDTRIILAPKDKFYNLVKMIPSLNKALLKYLTHSLEKYIAYANAMKMKRVRNRICMYLYSYLKLTPGDLIYSFNFNLEFFAGFLNITRTALSVELHALQSDGVLVLEKNRITVCDFDKLQKNTGLMLNSN